MDEPRGLKSPISNLLSRNGVITVQMSRRYFLQSSGALAVYCGLSARRVLADAGLTAGDVAPVTRQKTLVIIFLRGGMDGLNLVVPHGEAEYYKLRKAIAVAQPGQPKGALDLDGFFGLHPKAEALRPFFQSGLAVGLHAVGYAENTRSHFEEQDTWETGVIGNTVHSDGWLNRHLITSSGHGPVRAVAFGDVLPRILRGQAPAYAMRGIEDLTLTGTERVEDAKLVAALEHAYCTSPREMAGAGRDLLAQSARLTVEGVRQLKTVAATPYKPKVAYPETELGRRLKETARLIRAGLGLEVAEIDYGGWDTHSNQGGVDGAFGTLALGLAEAVSAFARDLEDRMDDILLLTLSDFGRTASENGTNGTDHGWANCMLALGGPVKRIDHAGRKVLGRWPGLAKEQLNQGRDLLHTTDFRDVLGEVVARHLGNDKLQAVLPGHPFASVGLV